MCVCGGGTRPCVSVRLCVGVCVCVSDKTTINYYHLNTGTGRHGLLLPVLLWKLQLTLPRRVFLLSSSRGGGGGVVGTGEGGRGGGGSTGCRLLVERSDWPLRACTVYTTI